jgi:hypothetical protein
MFKTLNPPHYQRRIIFPSSYLKPTEWWRLVVVRHEEQNLQALVSTKLLPLTR